MTETDYRLPFNRDQLKRTLNQLEGAFPKIETVPLDQEVLTSPYLTRLSRLLKLFIPIDAFPQKIKDLYHQISHFYHDHFFRVGTEEARTEQIDEKVIVEHVVSENNSRSRQCQQQQRIRSTFSSFDLGAFVSNFRGDQQTSVSFELIQRGRTFNSWKVKEVGALEFSKPKMQKQQSKPQNSEFKMGKQKYQKTEVVKNQSIKIFLGKNISLECKEMRHEIMNRAKSNKLLEENVDLTDLQKIGIEINYILNRITVQYFSEFLEELRPFAKHQVYSQILSEKIIDKVMEEHNFISIYCRLVKRLKNVGVLLGDRKVRFKNIFVERLQDRFYGLIRKGEWEEKEQFYKKQLIGMSLFVGQLFNIRFLSKYVFKDCFYELVRSYILQYYKYRNNKSIFYYETYIECVIKIIEKMNNYYDQLLHKKTTNKLQLVLDQLLDSPSKEDENFSHICDYIQLLKLINERLPSHRFKITFLLDDFRCSKVLSKERETLNNSEFDIIKSILSIDLQNKPDVSKIPEMLSGGKPSILMKDFYYQFAEGNLKQVNKHIEIFKIMSESKGICAAALSSFRENTEGLFIIESDFPFLCEGLAKVLKIVSEEKNLNFQELQLGQDDHEDEDVREFLQKIEEKYFKMIMQD